MGGVELILKDLVCGGDTRNFYVAGVDFDVNLLSMSAFNKPGSRLKGCTLWNNADNVVKNVKKALSLISKLKGKLVHLQVDFKFVGYCSGHNEMNFFRYILDGMYALDQEEK